MKQTKKTKRSLLPAILCFFCAFISAFLYIREEIPYAREKLDAQKRIKTYLKKSGQETAETAKDSSKIDLNVDFDALKAVNSDMIGWLYIPGASVNCPILKHPTKDSYYLTHTPEKKPGRLGSIYLHHDAADDFTDTHTILFGHNMKSGQMFGKLSFYKKEDFARTYPDVWILLPDKTLHAVIYSAYTCRADDMTYTVGYEPEGSSFQQFLNHTIEKSQIYIGKIPSKKDSILTLSTCAGAGRKEQRFVVNSFIKDEAEREKEKK